MTKKWKKSEREYLSRSDIEERVNRMLVHVIPDSPNNTYPPDLKKIVKVLNEKFNVRFSFKKNLGFLSDRQKILGMFMVDPYVVDPYTIQICNSLTKWSPIFNKTLAHEIGHLALHRKLIGKGKFISKDKPIIDTAEQLKYFEHSGFSDHDWVEWQANEFAMCLILPRSFLMMLVARVQKDVGITKNLGNLYLDDQDCNKRDSRRIVNFISKSTGADQKLVWKRLRYLGILEDKQKLHPKPAFEILDKLFNINLH